MHQRQQNQSKRFTKITDLFKIEATLSDSSIKISLQDYDDWTTYQKQYYESDIGKQIHRKADLADLFNSLQLTLQTDQKKMKQKEKGLIEEDAGKFGEIVMFNDISCFKVEKEGKITIYHSIIDQKTNKKIEYASNLSLTKVDVISEQEILILKIERQMKANTDEKGVYIKVQQLHHLIEYGKRALSNDNLQNRRQTSQRARHERNEKNDLLQQLAEKSKQIKRLNEKIETLEQQIKQQKQERSRQKEQKQKSYDTLYFFATKILTEINKNQIEANYFRVSGKVFECIKENYLKYKGPFSRFLIDKIVPINQNFSIKLRIVRLEGKMRVGIANFQEKKGKDQFIFQQDCHFSQGQNLKLSYKQGGELILVTESRKLYKIEDLDNRLMDNTRMYILFVELDRIGDILELIN